MKQIHLYATFLLLLCASTVAHAADTVTLAEDGDARVFIQISPDAKAGTFSVANEMVYYLQRMTGGTYEVRRAERAEGPRIILGTFDQFPHLGLKGALDGMEGATDDGFVMRTSGDTVLLLGRTPVGVSNAAFAFLERLGCRWFFPTEAWTIVPEKKTLQVQLDEKQVPDLWRRAIWYGAMNGNDSAVHLLKDWGRHNRMRQSREIVTHHTWAGLDPDKDFKAHPEWFALVDGKRQPSKPNYAHPEVVQRAIDDALEAVKNGAKSITVSAPDGLGFCECQLCIEMAGIKPDTLHKENLALFGTRPDGTKVCVTSETIFRLANKVARAVAKVDPDVIVGCHAYSGYAHPPTFDLEPNIFVQVTTRYRRTPLSFEEQLETFGERAKMVGVYEYYYVVVFSGHDHGPGGGVKIDYLSKRFPYYYKNSVRGLRAEASNSWGAAGLNFYVASKLMWDTSADAEAIYDDFLDKAFGAA